MNNEPLVSFRRLGRSFQGQALLAGDGLVRAVRDIDLDIAAGRTLGVVGESGCGKSTLGRMAVGLLEPSAGDVFIMGKPLYDKKAHADYFAFRRGLAGKVQMIFQDHYSSLNPRMSVGQSVAEPLVCAPAGNGERENGRAAVRERVARMLEQVGLEADAARRYPHEFSGGQRQRIAIARALITSPAFVVCDEPTSSLDASVQSQVLNLLRDMQRELKLTYMFISHDLAVVRHMSDRVAVMYRGVLVEEGDSEAVLQAPCHPYTRMLLESVPGVENLGGCERPEAGDGEAANVLPLRGDGADIAGPAGQEGCPFAPRCAYAMPDCRRVLPELRAVDKPAPVLCGKRQSGAGDANEQADAANAPAGLRLARCLLYTAL